MDLTKREIRELECQLLWAPAMHLLGCYQLDDLHGRVGYPRRPAILEDDMLVARLAVARHVSRILRAAQHFNDDVALRVLLSKAGAVQLKQYASTYRL